MGSGLPTIRHRSMPTSTMLRNGRADMAMDMEGQSPTAEQACFEKSDDLAGDSPGSIEAPKPANIQFERPDWMLFGSLTTLPTMAGVRAELLPRLGLKELADNALDAGANKVVVGALDGSGKRYFVQDDGPGIPGTPEDIARLFSISRPLVTSKLWRLPSRGAMGNGLRVVTGLVSASDGRLEVWTRNQRLILTPQEDGSTAVEAFEVDFPVGTRIEITFGPPLPVDPDALVWAAAAVQMAGGVVYGGKASPHWCDNDHFLDILKASGKRPVREIVAQMDGCSGQTAGRITAAFKGAASTVLMRDQAMEVLKRARAETRPVPAERLGKVGKLPSLPEWYAIEYGAFTIGGREPKAVIPFVVEAWVRVDPKGKSERDVVPLFVNRTPIIEEVLLYRDKDGFGLYGCGLNHMVDLSKGKYDITVSIITPYMPIISEGKQPDLSHFVEQIRTAVKKAAKKARKAIPRDRTITIKAAAWAVMEEAYLKTSKGGTLPANARQIMYAARTRILEMPGKKSLDDKYFTQRLLPDFVNAHPELTETWDVVFDDRGAMVEPHTDVEVGLGTIGVRDYLAHEEAKDVELHTGGILYPTSGPLNRYGGVLFIEKEGFNPLLKAVKIGKRFDIAIASTKGMSVVAIRKLLDEIQVPVYVLHDMDITGRTIYGTLTSDGRRFKYKNNITIHDLGLRYEDVIRMELQSEPFKLNTDEAKSRMTLMRYGASKGEISMLLDQQRRVELNAMTSEQFVEYVERRLMECDVKKVIPDGATMEDAYRRTLVQRRLEEEAEKMRAQAEWEANEADVPSDLADRVRKVMSDDSGLSWDRALIMVMDTAKRRR
jgi:DNA topoisomerase 6 subunit A-like protein